MYYFLLIRDRRCSPILLNKTGKDHSVKRGPYTPSTQSCKLLPFQHFLHLSPSITDCIFSLFPRVSQRDILGWSHPLLQGYTGGSGCEGGVGSHCNMHVQPPVAHPLAGDEDERRADRDQGLSAALQHKGRHCAAKSKIYAPCDLPSVSHSREPRANQCWYD